VATATLWVGAVVGTAGADDMSTARNADLVAWATGVAIGTVRAPLPAEASRPPVPPTSSNATTAPPIVASARLNAWTARLDGKRARIFLTPMLVKIIYTARPAGRVRWAKSSRNNACGIDVLNQDQPILTATRRSWVRREKPISEQLRCARWYGVL
jgi:hypothetical protein